MATTIRFTEVLNNNGVAVTGITYQERAISSDNFKWAYAGAGVASGSRFLEFYDADVCAERVCTITTASYDALTATTQTITSGTVTGTLEDAPVGNNTAFYFNYENISLLFLSAPTSTTGNARVEYVFRDKIYNFTVNVPPSGLNTLATTSNLLRVMAIPFPLNFINYNRTDLRYPQASGTSGCIISRKFIKSAQTLPTGDTDTRYAPIPGIVTEIKLDTPNNLILASTAALNAVLT
jgi:hypothetical protein